MKRNLTLLLAGLLATSVSVPAVFAQTPRYINGELVSIDVQTRLIGVRGSNGERETLKLDDNVAGLEGLKVGDWAILTIRGEPGMRRVAGVTKSTAPAQIETAATSTASAEREGPDDALRAFARQVAGFAQQASRVDALWTAFRDTCKPSVGPRYDGGREWFSLWDNQAQADLSNGACRDLFNQIVSQGETVKAGMLGAEDAARRASVLPGSMREVRQQYSMEWEGWGLPAPDHLRQ
jgi:hypothetical protein